MTSSHVLTNNKAIGMLILSPTWRDQAQVERVVAGYLVVQFGIEVFDKERKDQVLGWVYDGILPGFVVLRRNDPG